MNQSFFQFHNFFEFKVHPQEHIQFLYSVKISQIISHHFQRFFLSYRIINPSQRKRSQLTTQYSNQVHIKIWTITTKLQNQIQKLKNISCQRNWLNFIHFLSIQLHTAENQRIKYIHKLTSNTVLNIVMNRQNQTGSHFIELCINPKIQAQTTNRIIKYLILNLELISKYKIGNNQAHARAEIKTCQFWPEDSIQK